MPRISVCIPTYKNEKTLEDTLISIWNQEFKDYDIVRREDEEGKGLADNLNNLVKMATGEILVFIAGDDILLPNALQLISDEFKRSDKLGFVTRPHYWFKDNWRVPVRKTKMKDFKIEDAIFLSGQMSGMAIKKECIKTEFKELRFVEFVSGILPLIKLHEFSILHESTVAIRMTSSESCNSKVYEQSPILNWHKVINDTFEDNQELMRYMEKKLTENFISLIQIRMYAGWVKTMREVAIMFNLNSFIVYNPKFWFYFALVQLPSGVLKRLRNWFIDRVNRRLCR